MVIKESGIMVLEAIYNQKGESIDINSEITGEMENLFYVLKVVGSDTF